MRKEDVITTVQFVVGKSEELKNAHTDAVAAPVEFACVFCQDQEEYRVFTKEIETFGKIVETTPSGYTYLLDKPIVTVAGPLRLVKIRKPDPKMPQRGDADFNTDYEGFKKHYGSDPKFERVIRPMFEMLRLSDPDFDVMVCFSSIPKSKELGIKF